MSFEAALAVFELIHLPEGAMRQVGQAEPISLDD
jgi:hypothetical protein